MFKINSNDQRHPNNTTLKLSQSKTLKRKKTANMKLLGRSLLDRNYSPPLWIKKNFMAPFYGWGSTASRLEPLRGGSLLFTTKFQEISGTHFTDLGRMKG